MPSTQTPLADAIDARCAALEAGNSKRATRSALDRFAEFLAAERDVTTIETVDATDCRRWAQALRDEVRDGTLAASTAQSYYGAVRAAFSWWVRDGRIDANPAARERAVEELPEDTRDPDRQFWSVEQRRQLLRHTDRAVEAALDDVAERDDEQVRDEAGDGAEAAAPDDGAVLLAYCDRALAYVLALTGVRSAEVLRDPANDKRTGLRWSDVGDGTLRVLGKTREWQATAMIDAVRERIKR